MIYKVYFLFIFSSFSLLSCKAGKGCDCPTWGKHADAEGQALVQDGLQGKDPGGLFLFAPKISN
jgi:hypothetical protein